MNINNISRISGLTANKTTVFGFLTFVSLSSPLGFSFVLNRNQKPFSCVLRKDVFHKRNGDFKNFILIR